MMLVRIDYDLCEANGACVQAAPEVFQLDDQDRLQLLAPSPPDGQREAVETAIRRCPRRALSLVDP
jgi:ferredoxin